ncbi:hypothetical protein Tco_0386679 [Tanacetum coccineum]
MSHIYVRHCELAHWSLYTSDIERIEKTKRSKNDQKPTRNGKRQRVKSKSEESARDHSRISPTQSKKETMKSKTQDKVKRASYDKFSKSQGLTWSFEV